MHWGELAEAMKDVKKDELCNHAIEGSFVPPRAVTASPRNASYKVALTELQDANENPRANKHRVVPGCYAVHQEDGSIKFIKSLVGMIPRLYSVTRKTGRKNRSVDGENPWLVNVPADEGLMVSEEGDTNSEGLDEASAHHDETEKDEQRAKMWLVLCELEYRCLDICSSS
jgi:hypothetical protein